MAKVDPALDYVKAQVEMLALDIESFNPQFRAVLVKIQLKLEEHRSLTQAESIWLSGTITERMIRNMKGQIITALIGQPTPPAPAVVVPESK